MTRCDDIRGRLDDWLDDLLDAVARAEVDAHLDKCPDCASLFQRHQDVADDLLVLGLAADHIADTAMPAAAPRWSRWRPLFGVAAAVLFLVTASLYLTKPWRDRVSGPIVWEDQPAQRTPDFVPHPRLADAADAAPPSSEFDVTCGKNRMAVRMKSSNPRIHIVWFYDQVLPADGPAGGETGAVPPSSS